MMFATSLFLGTVPKLLLDVLFIISCSFDVLGTLFRYIIIQVHYLFNLKMFRINSVILGWLETFFMNTSLSQSFLDFSSFGMPLWIIRTLPYTSGCSTTFNYFCAFFICWWHYYWTTWRWLNSIFTEANFVVFLYIRIIILQIVLKETAYEFFNFKINHNIPHLHFAKTLYSCFRRLYLNNALNRNCLPESIYWNYSEKFLTINKTSTDNPIKIKTKVQQHKTVYHFVKTNAT